MPAETAKNRDLARDIRTNKQGEVMAEPNPPGRRNFWLRPVGGGIEWEVPPKFLQIIGDDNPGGSMTHGEYECPGCVKLAEYEVVRDVYGCNAGRHCTQVTPDQRLEFERMIAERLAALPAEEKTP